MKTKTTLILILAALTSCDDGLCSETAHNYTVWLGNSVVAGGYHTSEYQISDGWITFRNKEGVQIKAPVQNILRIEKIATNTP